MDTIKDYVLAILLLPVFVLLLLFLQGATEFLSGMFGLTLYGWIICYPIYLLGNYIYKKIRAG
jgi:hypothetical protein